MRPATADVQDTVSRVVSSPRFRRCAACSQIRDQPEILKEAPPSGGDACRKRTGPSPHEHPMRDLAKSRSARTPARSPPRVVRGEGSHDRASGEAGRPGPGRSGDDGVSRKNADGPLPRFHPSAVPDIPREVSCAPPRPTCGTRCRAWRARHVSGDAVECSQIRDQPEILKEAPPSGGDACRNRTGPSPHEHPMRDLAEFRSARRPARSPPRVVRGDGSHDRASGEAGRPGPGRSGDDGASEKTRMAPCRASIRLPFPKSPVKFRAPCHGRRAGHGVARGELATFPAMRGAACSQIRDQPEILKEAPPSGGDACRNRTGPSPHEHPMRDLAEFRSARRPARSPPRVVREDGSHDRASDGAGRPGPGRSGDDGASRKNADGPLPRFHPSAVPDIPREVSCAPPRRTCGTRCRAR